MSNNEIEIDSNNSSNNPVERFTYYEKFHLHDYVHHKDDHYDKTEIDGKLDIIEDDITDLDTITQTIQNEIDNIDAKIQIVETDIVDLNTRTETLELDQTTKSYVDTELASQKAIISSDVVNRVSSDLKETKLWEYYVTHGTAIYRFDRGTSSEMVVDYATRKVSVVFDQTLNENHAEQTISTNQPLLCTKANKNNKRYYLEFNGTQRMKSDIDLNPGAGEQDIVNVFLVYKLATHTSSHNTFSNGLFGHDNGGWDKFVCFSINGDLIIAGTSNEHIVIGDNTVNNKAPIAGYKNKAFAGEFNKWICLSIHWNLPKGNNGSSVWCNGKKLCDFTARSSQGSNKMTFGDLNPIGLIGLKGNIALFALYKNHSMTDADIKLHHKVFCENWYNIDHDLITI